MFKFHQCKTKAKNGRKPLKKRIIEVTIAICCVLLLFLMAGILVHRSIVHREALMMGHHLNGVAFYEQEMYQRSIEEFSRAIELVPSYNHAYYGRANSLNKLGEYRTALEDCMTALAIDDNYAPGYATRAYTFLMMKNYDLAIHDFNTAINIEPDRAYFYNSRGYTYLAIDEYEAAIEDFTEAINLNPESTHLFNPYSNRAFSNFQLGNMDTVFDDYTRAIELDPDNPVIFQQRGMTYYASGIEYYELALADYEHYIELEDEIDPAMLEQITEMQIALDNQE